MLDNSNTKPDLRKKMLALHALVHAEFPDLFSLERPVPFRIGIHNQMIERYPNVPRYLVKRLLGWLTCRRDYLMACAVPGVPRYDFDGPCGTLSAGEAEHSRRKFVQRNSTAKDPWDKARYAA